MNDRKTRIIVILIGAVCTLGLIGAVAIGPDRLLRKIQGIGTLLFIDRSYGEREFPELNHSTFSNRDRVLAAVLQREFAAQSNGEKYSQGTHEAWCANFVSWVMKESGAPLVNPNTDSWRIPGTYTLLDYYKSDGRFREVDSDYQPVFGDVAIYRASPIFGDHTNIVLKNENGVLTTIGGNENGRIRVYKNSQKNTQGLLGYGVSQH